MNKDLKEHESLELGQTKDLSLQLFAENKENSESLLRKKRNFFFKIEKNYGNKFSKRSEKLPEIGHHNENFKNNFSSTTNLSKESSGKGYKKKIKREEERKKIMEKNLVKLYSINSLRMEDKPKQAYKGTSALSFGKKDFLNLIKTKNNFITLNKQLSSDINFAKINFINPNFGSDSLKLNINKKNKSKNEKQIKIKNDKNASLANNSDCSLISELNEKSFLNLTNCNSSLFKKQPNFSVNKKNNINLNGDYNNRNKVYNLIQTASSTSLEFGNFTYLNLDLFEKSELYSERVESLQSFLNQKAQEKINDEKNYLFHSKNTGEMDEDIDEKMKMDDYSLDLNNHMHADDKIAIKQRRLETIEDEIVNYECVFPMCDRTLDNRKEWEAHYLEHLKNQTS